MSVAIVGCGLIGKKRAAALKGAQVSACVDQVQERAVQLAAMCQGASAHTDWREIMRRDDIKIVIIATLHASLAEIALAAVEARKHVLIEKPGGRKADELLPVIAAARESGSLVRIGFNHRYHRAFREARKLVDAGKLGELMFIRARYGHGGRIGYDREWRADPLLSGGGELIDQGMHLIDLARWFLGDFETVDGFSGTYFWDMPVDDNGFLLLKTPKKQVAFLHASCTEWKNTFSFEIYGRLGKIDITGLGGSYGVERMAWYQMLPEMGPPATVIHEFPMADDSWEVELQEFLEDIRLKRQPAAGLLDAHAALHIVGEIYRMSAQ